MGPASSLTGVTLVKNPLEDRARSPGSSQVFILEDAGRERWVSPESGGTFQTSTIIGKHIG